MSAFSYTELYPPADVSSRSERGFSLPELLVVLTLSGTLIALALPYVPRGSSLEKEAEMIQGQIRILRRQSLSTGISYSIAARSRSPDAPTDEGGDALTFTPQSSQLHPEHPFTKALTLSFSPHLQLSITSGGIGGAPNQLQLYSGGTISPGRIRIQQMGVDGSRSGPWCEVVLSLWGDGRIVCNDRDGGSR